MPINAHFSNATDVDVVKKPAGNVTLTVLDLNKFIVVEPSGGSNTINLPDVGAPQINSFIEIYNNGIIEGAIAVAGGDTLIGSTVMPPGTGTHIKVSDTDEWIAIGTGELVKNPFTESFNAGSWSLHPSGGYRYSVLESTHSLGTGAKIVQVFNDSGYLTSGSGVSLSFSTYVDTTTGDVTLTTASGTTFGGDIIIAG